MRIGWPLLLLCASCSSGPAIPPGGIVSNNPCIDAILAEVAAPGQIAAVSAYSHNPASGSAPLTWARALPALGTSAEEIIAAKPRMVLTGNLASAGTNAALAKAGVEVKGFGVPASLAQNIEQIREVAQAIGRMEAGERLIARIGGAVGLPSPSGVRQSSPPDWTKGRTGLGVGSVTSNTSGNDTPHSPTLSPQGEREKKSAIIWQGGGFVAGQNTLQDELLTLAGFRNASDSYGLKQWDILPLETLIRNPPDVIFMPTQAKWEEGRALDQRMRLLVKASPKTRIVNFPDKLLFCGGPTIIDAMRVLRSGFPSPSGEGLGVGGVTPNTERRTPPTPTPPRKGRGST